MCCKVRSVYIHILKVCMVKNRHRRLNRKSKQIYNNENFILTEMKTIETETGAVDLIRILLLFHVH